MVRDVFDAKSIPSLVGGMGVGHGARQFPVFQFPSLSLY